MKHARGVVAALLAAVSSVVLAGAVQAAPKPSFAEPALSPDGTEIAFASGGDIWTVPAQGGTARLLVSDPATESRPVYSPDGTQLAFQSTRDGFPNIYVLTFATGEIKRLTFADAGEVLDGWSADGKWIYFTSSINDVGRQGDIFRVPATGGTPLEVSREVYLNEFESAPSPDGKEIALIAKGISNSQWWRKGHSHIDETELWLKPVNGDAYRRLLGPTAKHAWPMWSQDGRDLYLMSDESGAENIVRVSADGGAATAVTHFTSGRVLYPSIGGGDAIVFERGFAIWKLDPRTGQAAEVPITLRGAPAAAGQRQLNETSFRSMSLSPDGKKVVLVAHGEVFAASAKDGGQGQRLTHTVGSEGGLVWSPDSRRVAYTSERGPDSVICVYDFATNTERQLTADKGADTGPAFSPDGKRLAYVHGEKELRVITLGDEGKGGDPKSGDRVLFTGALEGGEPTWSPDSRWLAFVVGDHKSFANVNVIEAAGGTARPVTFLANGQTGRRIAWSPDGKYLLLSTAQRSEDANIVRIDLLPHVPKFREDSFRDLFRRTDQPDRPTNRPTRPGETPTTPGTAPATPASTPAHPVDPATERPATDQAANEGGEGAKPAGGGAKKPVPPVEIVFEGIRDRVSTLPLGLSAEDPLISPDGKTLVFRASSAGQDNLYSYDLDELTREPPAPRQITASRRRKSDAAFSPDGKEIYYLENGVVTVATLGGGEGAAGPGAGGGGRSHPVAINAEMTVDFDAEKQAVFDEAWSTLNRRYYDPAFHGADWAALRTQWEPYIQGARTPDELRRDINLLIGELNSSHSGINRGEGGPQPRVGQLGLLFERAPYEAGRGLVIRQVVALSPAAIEGTIRPGDTLLAVNGQPVGANVNLDSLLLDTVGKRTVLSIAAADGKKREAVVRPVPAGVEAGLAYRQWVDGRRAYVEKISGGRIGYVHIADMSDQSLQQLYLDLDAQNQSKDGVVVDIRNNNGGYVNGYALDVLTRRNYLMMTPRDRFPVPSRQALGQRALGLPSVLVTNESSLSDAEDFTEGYRSLGLGKVVGVPTAGWIIFTGSQPLVDGSTVRVPGVKIQDLRGQDMELHPRPVDVEVERPLGESETGHDVQLEAAVKTLLVGASPNR